MAKWSDRLSQAIEDRGWSVRELSARSGVPYHSVAKYLQHKVDQPRGDTVRKLASALDIDPLWLKDGVNRGKQFGVPVVGYVGKLEFIS